MEIDPYLQNICLLNPKHRKVQKTLMEQFFNKMGLQALRRRASYFYSYKFCLRESFSTSIHSFSISFGY